MPRFASAAIAALLIAGPAFAQDPKPAKPITQQEPNAADVVTTPVSDLNLKKVEIPQLLVAAQSQPYTTAGLRTCPRIAAAVGELDAVLGDDLDVPASGSGQKLSAGRVAQAAVANFIPFRGLIREVSGANAHDRKVAVAIQAGVARRAFLKGYGEARGCRYPARSLASAAAVAAR